MIGTALGVSAATYALYKSGKHLEKQAKKSIKKRKRRKPKKY